jgi:hypothetical protein
MEKTEMTWKEWFAILIVCGTVVTIFMVVLLTILL